MSALRTKKVSKSTVSGKEIDGYFPWDHGRRIGPEASR